MADAEKNLKISIKSQADTKGLIEATTGINRMADAERRRDEVRAAFLNASEREVAEINRLAEASKKLQEVNDKVSPSAKSVGVDVSKMGMLANQASYQIGDFFTQVQMGTSATRAFSQQAPQMIGALQMAGIVTGGWGLALAGVAAAIPLVGMMIERFSSSTNEAADAVSNLSEKAGKMDVQRLNLARQAMEFTLDSARELAREYPGLEQASKKAAVAVANDSNIIAESQRIVNDLLNKQVDAYLEIEAASNREAARRRATLEQQVAEQREAAQKAFQAQKKAADDLLVVETDLSNRMEMIQNKRRALTEMRLEMDAYEAKLKEWQSRPSDAPTTFGTFQSYAPKPQIPSGLEGRIKEIEDSLNQVTGELIGITSKGGKLDRARLDLQEATKNATAIQLDLEKATEVLENTAKKTAAKDRLETVAELGAKQAADVEAVLNQIVPQTEEAKRITGQLRGVVSDHEIAIEENSKFTGELNRLIGQLQYSDNAGNQDLIKEIKRIQKNQMDFIKQLKEVSDQNDRIAEAQKQLGRFK